METETTDWTAELDELIAARDAEALAYQMADEAAPAEQEAA